MRLPNPRASRLMGARRSQRKHLGERLTNYLCSAKVEPSGQILHSHGEVGLTDVAAEDWAE